MAGLNAEEARIFRITHIRNVPWLLENGLHCQNSDEKDPNFVVIGIPDLIEKRQYRQVPLDPGGMLSDYVPFYFTPFSIMMYKIHTGHDGVKLHPNQDIVVLVSSVHRLIELDAPFVFTNGHAYMEESKYFNSADRLDQIDWELLRSRNFQYDPEDPGKQGRYQAETLVYRHMPVDSLLSIACYNNEAKMSITDLVDQNGLSLRVLKMEKWYF